MISFCAKYISPVNIIKENKEIEASFVEFEPDSKEDLKTLENVAKLWESPSNFSECIRDAFRIYTSKISGGKKPDINYYFYGITTQKDNFDKIKPDNVLTLAQLYSVDKNTKEIDYLQTSPKTNYDVKESAEFKHSGHAMLDSIKKVFPNTNFTLTSLSSAAEFYRKNGFEPNGKNEFIFYGGKTYGHK